MKLLCTGDWQASFANLGECETVLREVLAAAREQGVDAIIHLGDVKESYDNIPLLVTKFAVRAVRTLAAEFPFYILLGNHDRISQSANSKNWLDILRAAGARTVSKPRVYQIGDGYVAFLPFTPDKKQEKVWAQELADEVDKRMNSELPTVRGRVLAFHTDVAGACMNATGLAALGNSKEDLRMGQYDACIGGHLHLQQKIGKNIWYCGSPFAQDWSEANQTHGNMLLETTPDGQYVEFKHLPTKIPGWWTADYLAEHPEIKPGPGALIRSRLAVSSKQISAALDEEEKRLASLYRGSRVLVVPHLEKREKEALLTGKDDRENVEQYVAQTLPEGVLFDSRLLVRYLAGKLAKTRLRASQAQLRVVYLEGENLLSFEKVKINYNRRGLVMIRGENQDWGGARSNGSGKTNFLNLLPVIWFGQTLKDQKDDGWARERTTDRAWGRLVLRDGAGRKFEIVRQRRPHAMAFHIDGEDVSTGISGKGKHETQGRIEDETGFNLQMLKNSVYIDQTIANGFVYGTQKERMDLISKFLDFARFEAALAAIKIDVAALNRGKEKAQDIVESWESKIGDLTADLADLAPVETNWGAQLAEAKKREARCKKVAAKLAAELDAVDTKTLEKKQAEAGHLLTTLGDLQAQEAGCVIQLRRAKDLIRSGNCPQCGQPSGKIGERWLADAENASKAIQAKKGKVETDYSAAQSVVGRLERRLTECQVQHRDASAELKEVRESIRTLAKAAEEENQRNSHLVQRRERLTKEIGKAKRIQRACRDRLKDIDVEASMLDFACKAMARSGMPLYLANSLCPVLNSAATEYSEVFTQGRIQVRFDVVDGEFTVDAVNPSGSVTLNGQSTGERAMAGLVTAFAVREAAPKTNLLVLDEPGSGLDPEGQREFARGLLKLKNKWDTILCVTHSGVIEGILSGETIWTVKKQRGVSRLTKSR